jgi:hypothetical protein
VGGGVSGAGGGTFEADPAPDGGFLYGLVYIYSATNPLYDAGTGEVTAAFLHYPVNPFSVTPTTRDLGNGCYTYDFDGGYLFDGGVFPSSSATAGTISVSSPSAQVTLPPDGGYYIYTGSAVFSTGDLVTVSATGAEVPAFNASITAPGAINMNGVPTDGGRLLIDRQTGYTVAWTGATSDIYVELIAGSAVFICRPPAGVSSQLLSGNLLSSVPDGGTGLLVVLTEKTSVTHAGPWPVNLLISNTGSYVPVDFR